jgi:exonuclease SbcD
MLRILHAADVHLGVRRYGTPVPPSGINSRILDFAGTLGRAVKEANDKADLLVLAGDTFDNRRPGPEELAALTAALSVRQTPVVIIPGNHDGMTTIGDPATHALNWMAAADLPGVYVLTGAGWHTIHATWGSLHVFALPYPHKRAFDSVLRDLPIDERPNEAARRLESAIATLAVREPGGIGIAVAHLSTLGAGLTETTSMRMGWDVAVRPETFDIFDATLLGHVHRQQQVAENAWYAGSPEYMDFGEVTQTKGFLLWEVEAGQKPVVTSIPSGARPMVRMAATCTRERIHVINPDAPDLPDVAGAIVRLDVTGTERPNPADLAALVRAVRDRGAAFVQTKVDVAGQVVRGEIRVDAEDDIIETLGRWLSTNGHPEEPALTAGKELVAALAD